MDDLTFGAEETEASKRLDERVFILGKTRAAECCSEQSNLASLSKCRYTSRMSLGLEIALAFLFVLVLSYLYRRR